jgi:hypothetical protein
MGEGLGVWRRALIYLGAVGSLFALVSSTAYAEPTTLVVPPLAKPPSLSGKVDDSWANSAAIQLNYDFAYRRGAPERTVVRIAQDPAGLDVAVEAAQRSRLTASQTTNGPAVYNDDYVTVALWPQGARGFAYTFTANVLGARYQTSSENSAYSPQWEAAGLRDDTGYSLTIRIPINVIRTGGSKSWRMQIVRYVATAGSIYEWTYADQQSTPYDPVYAGPINLSRPDTETQAKPPPRLQVYGLAQIAKPDQGGNTSRLGGDLSLPVTKTSSFLATVHPDYSNVEIDQQSIAPNEFPRQFQEVRPFFTQAGQNYNNVFYCATCPLTVYTPAIPAFRSGYALEGTQGLLSFAAFDADGYFRNDAAQVLTYNYADRSKSVTVSAQNAAANIPGIHDDTATLSASYLDVSSHIAVWANAGQEQGTLTSDSSKATWREYGIAYTTPTTQFGVDHLHIGPKFNPIDGYVANNDIDGWSAFGTRTINGRQGAFIRSISANASISAYNNSAGQLSQVAQSLSLAVSTRPLIGLFASTGSSYLLLPSGGLTPFTQESIGLTYRAGTSTPMSTTFASGRYYHGGLTSWFNAATFQIVRRIRLSLEVDRTRYIPDNPAAETTALQWLQRASLDYQLSRYASLDVGARRIVGIFAPSGFGPPSTEPVNAGNITAAFHLLSLRNEFYVIYGQPNSLSTSPTLYLKFIRYVGAPKGT